MGEYAKKKKNMVFPSFDSLQQVVNIINEAAAALNDKIRTINKSSIPEILSAAGMATAGAIVGGGIAAGVLVLAGPVAGLAVAGLGLASHLKKKQLRQEKMRLYEEALKKHQAIIQALKDELEASKERLEYLQSLNILLTQAIKDLQKDLGITA